MAAQVHHVDSRNGERLLASEDWLAICNGCHQRIHSQPAWARARGLLK